MQLQLSWGDVCADGACPLSSQAAKMAHYLQQAAKMAHYLQRLFGGGGWHGGQAT